MLFDDDERAFAAAVRDMAVEHVAPIASTVDERDEFPEQLLKVFAGLGLIGLAVPERYGGPGGTITAVALARETIARSGSMALAQLAGQNSFAVLPLLAVGTEEQRQRFLPELAAGAIACLCLTEPGAGSDAGGITTRAVRDGDCYVITGQKCYITWGRLARYAVVVARTGTGRGLRGLSCFLAETAWPGFVESRRNGKLGQRGVPNVDVFLDGLRVPAANMLGEEGHGFAAAIGTLHALRPTAGALSVGVAQAAYDHAVDYVRRRQVHGRPLSHQQGIRWMLADMATEIEAARCLVYQATRQHDAGGDTVAISSMAKVFATEMGVRVTNEALQLLGGAGYLTDHPVERYLRDARVATIYEGTTQIQKNTIARALLDG